MAWVIVLLLLLAAAFGMLAAVLKAVAFIILTILLTIAGLIAIAWYSVKSQIRRWERGDIDGRPQVRIWSRNDRHEHPRNLPSHDDRY